MISSIKSYIWRTSGNKSPIDEIILTINGKIYKVNSVTVPVDTSLNTFIRNHAHLTGTKFMCLEGGCGACIVNISSVHPVTREKTTWAVNSCLFPVFACHGKDVLTIKGIGNKKKGYHPAQQRLARFNGTQCGYCSPGMVMNMYSLLESRKGRVTMQEVENSFGGNICRCTGYRPILDAFKSMAVDADEKLEDACHDIEDLPKNCPKTGNLCSTDCPTTNQLEILHPIHLLFDDRSEWYKVSSINDIFAVFERIEDKSYMLVAGNTAHGVYRRSDNLQIFIDINDVAELHSYSLSNELVIGGNVPLTEFVTILKTATNRNTQFSYCNELIKHIDMTANVPVRNTGTIAGNLMIKNQHHEFPSDCYLLLETIGAQLTIVEAGSKLTNISPKDFVNLNMNKKIIKNVILPAYNPSEYVFRSFKIMPRAQNAHAYVNGAFLIKLKANSHYVISARICFGGINPNFTHATATELFLTNKPLFDNTTIQAVISILASELNPDWILPDASSEYRKSLAISLFYKFVLQIAPEGFCKSEYKSGGAILERPLSSGKQSFDTIEKKWPLTKNIPKIEALAQTAGEAHYSNDLPPQPGELYAAFVLATQVHHKIAKLDASNALRLPGVFAFFSAKDIPGKNDFMTFEWLYTEAEEIFCSGRVLYHSQPVGIIVAKSFNQAQKAASTVEITYEKIDSKPILPTLKSVLSSEAQNHYVDNPLDVKEDDFEIVPAVTATKTIKGRMEMTGTYHFTMETHTCVCVPIEDGMDVYLSTQWMHFAQRAISESLLIPMNSLNMYVRRVGGSFGGKISRTALIACACALAAHLTQRTVRLVLPIETNMSAIAKRFGFVHDYLVVADEHGKIVKLDSNFSQDCGVSINEYIGPVVIDSFPNCYDGTSWSITGKAVRTDSPTNIFGRAPGNFEATIMIENVMEHVAHETGVDPLNLRLLNMPKDSEIHQLLPQFLESTEFADRRQRVDVFNASNRWKKRGIAIVPFRYKIAYIGQRNALVSIFGSDGTVAITHGGIEMGQGVNTKVAQAAAFTFGIPLEKIMVKPSTSNISPNSLASGGSFTSESICYAVLKASDILLNRMKPIRLANSNASWEKIVQLSYDAHVDLCAEAQYKAEELQNYFSWGISCVELEVDILTGNVQISRVDILEDTGESMSPGIDVGQVEGAFVMGIGYFLTEALVYDTTTGALLTNRSWNYKPPGAKDIPIDFRVNFLHGSRNPIGVLGSKSAGEPPMCLSIAVLLALRYALRSARKDAGLPDEWFKLNAPTTVDQIFLLAGNKFDQYLLN